MLTQRRTNADVQIIFVTDDIADAEHLAKSLSKSEYRVIFRSHSSCASSLVSILQSVSIDQPFLPTAVIIDYFCKNARCFELLRDIKETINISGVELVVANAPNEMELADELIGLGADVIVDAEASLSKSRLAN